MKYLVQAKFSSLCQLLNKPEEMIEDAPKEVLERISRFHSIFANLPAHLESNKRERFLLNSYCDISSLQINSDTLDAAFNGDDNIFEIYALDFTQIFRSLSFFNFKTYSLLTLMIKSNFELYTREPHLIPVIQEQLSVCLEKAKNITFNVPAHMVWESEGTPTYFFVQKLGTAGPVFNEKGELAGFLVSHNTRQVFQTPFRPRPVDHLTR